MEQYKLYNWLYVYTISSINMVSINVVSINVVSINVISINAIFHENGFLVRSNSSINMCNSSVNMIFGQNS